MTAPLPFADPTISSVIMMTGVDDRRNNGVSVNNSNCDDNIIITNTIGNVNGGDGNFPSSSDTLVKQPAHPANDGNDTAGNCADGDDTAKNTSSDDDDHDDDDDFEVVSLEEDRPRVVQNVTPISPMENGLEEEPCRSASAIVRDDDCREELTRFFLREKQASSQSPDTPPSSHPHRLRPLLLRVPPHTPLLLDVATTFPVIAHIHPSSPLRDHVSLGDVLVYIDGKNSVQWSFEALTRRLNSDAFGADGVERKKKTKKKKRKGTEERSGNGNEEQEQEQEQADEAAEGYRTLIVLPKEQFQKRPRRKRRKSADVSSGEETESASIGVVTPAKDRRPPPRDGDAAVILPCIATPTTTTTTAATTTSIGAPTAITTTNDVTLDRDDGNDDNDKIEHPHGKDRTTVAERTNAVVVVAATDDNVTADDGNETRSETKAASATNTFEKKATTTIANREPISEEDEVESVRNSLELSNPMAVTKGDGNGNGEEGVRDENDDDEEEEEVDIIDENVRENVHSPTTGPPPANNPTATPEPHPPQHPNENKKTKDEEEREYENLKRLVLRLQSQTSSLSPHQRRIYEESYELLKERDRELRRNRPPVDIDVIAIRRRGDGCVSLRIHDRDDGDEDEDENEEFSVEEVSTIYGGKWNPAMYLASPRRLEDVLGYDVEEGYGYGGFHHDHHLSRDGNPYLTLAQGNAHDNPHIPPSHHLITNNTHSKHPRLDIPHPNILGLLHPATHRYRYDADARDALLKEQDDQVRQLALESLKKQQKRVEGFFVSLMFASVGALIVILVMVFWAKD